MPAGLTGTIIEWKSKGLTIEKIKLLITAHHSLSPKLKWYNSKIWVQFKGSCLKQDLNSVFTPRNVVNLYIVYELDVWSWDLSTDFTLKDCFFGAVKLIKMLI